MADTWQPSLEDLAQAFLSLADRVEETERVVMEPYVEQQLRDAVFHLELYIPGFDPPFDADAAQALAKAAEAALERGSERDALARALRGLSHAPHDPRLFYVAASACFESGAVELALRLLCHTLWIHPGHRAARADLEALSAFLDDTDDSRAA